MSKEQTSLRERMLEFLSRALFGNSWSAFNIGRITGAREILRKRSFKGLI